MDYYSDFDDLYFKTSYGNIFYKHHRGEGASIVFLHGMGSSTMSWIKPVEYLDKNYDIYLIDLLGHGKSDAPKLHYNVDLQVEIINEFLKEIKIKPTLVGHSYGGWVSALYASEFDNCKCLVLEDNAGFATEADDKSNVEDEFDELMKIQGNHDYVLKDIMDSKDNTYLTDDLLGKIDEQTLFIWGELDNIVPLTDQIKLDIEKIKNSNLIIIPGAQHVPHYSNPKEFDASLEKFINQSK